MLLRLLQDQIGKYWPYIKYGIQESTPQEIVSEGVLNNVLEALLGGGSQCWLSVIEGNPEYEIKGFLITALFKDTTFGVNVLRILYVYGFTTIPKDEWITGYETLVKFGQGNECKVLDGFTDNALLLEVAKKAGFRIETHVVKEI